MSSIDRAATVIRPVLSPGGASNRLLRIGLGLLALVGSLAALGRLVSGFPWGVDLVIPLQAAGRWLAGGRAYVPEAFANGPGYDLPFLYPPYALPLFAPLTAVPLQPLQATWFAAGLTAAVATCRWLGVKPRWIPLMLVWPPFAEGLIAGNVQVAIFAAFVLLLGGAVSHRSDATTRRARPPLVGGLLGAATTFLKVSQPHVVVHLFRRDRRAAVVAILAITSLVVATLPLTGTAIWLDWVDMLRRAADPGWALGGPSLARLLPSPFGTLIVLACLAAVLAIPRAHAAAWVGVLLVLGAPSLHTYYLLFLLPAMLRIRREIALIADQGRNAYHTTKAMAELQEWSYGYAAFLVTTYTEPGWWLAIAIVAGALALSRSHTGLLELPKAADGKVAAEQYEAQAL